MSIDREVNKDVPDIIGTNVVDLGLMATTTLNVAANRRMNRAFLTCGLGLAYLFGAAGCDAVSPTISPNPADTRPAMTETLAAAEGFNPIEQLNNEEFKTKLPTEYAELTTKLQTSVPAWNSKELNIDYYSFRRQENGNDVQAGWATIISVDGIKYVGRPSSDGKFIVSPLCYQNTDEGVSYFTLDSEGNMVPFMESTASGTTAYLPDGTTVTSPVVLENPNATGGKIASPVDMDLFTSVSFDESTGVLTGKSIDGKDKTWDGTQWKEIVTAESFDVTEVMKSLDLDQVYKNSTELWNYRIKADKDGVIYLYQYDTYTDYRPNSAVADLAIATYDTDTGKWIERTPEEIYRSLYDRRNTTYSGQSFPARSYSIGNKVPVTLYDYMHTGEFQFYEITDKNGQQSILTTENIVMEDSVGELHVVQRALALGPDGTREATNVKLQIYVPSEIHPNFFALKYEPLDMLIKYGVLLRGEPGQVAVSSGMTEKERSFFDSWGYVDLGLTQYDAKKVALIQADLQMNDTWVLPEGLEAITSFRQDKTTLMPNHILPGYEDYISIGNRKAVDEKIVVGLSNLPSELNSPNY